ncbi:MAG TPA: hypothetical protein VKV30_01700, partial [Candidatus Angelobacter sp.]|nr:hypothetical protein [Candidatus Angelobacter sp.]
MKHPSLVVLYSVFGIITGTATFILSTESGFLRDAFFRECDVRFYAENSPEHEHRIAIHNSAAQPIDVSVIETFTPEMSLVDLTFAAVDPSGETSFLQVLRGASSTQRNGDGLGDVLASLDAHYEPASLRSVDTALRKAREHRIARLGSTGSSMSKHIQRLSKCSGDPERPDCKDEVEVERWERSVLE